MKNINLKKNNQLQMKPLKSFSTKRYANLKTFNPKTKTKTILVKIRVNFI